MASISNNPDRRASCGCLYDGNTGRCISYCSDHDPESPNDGPYVELPQAVMFRTPEPWFAKPCPCGDEGCTSWRVDPIADVQGLQMHEREAKMVAAGPKALELLADVLGWAHYNVPRDHLSVGWTSIEDRIRRILATIPDRQT